MAITSYSGMLPYVMPRVPGASSILCRQALQLKARDFCYETEAMLDRNRKFDLVADQKTYTLTTSSAVYEIIRPKEVRIASTASIAAGDYGQVQDPVGFRFWKGTAVLEFDSAPSSAALTNGLEVDLIISPLEDTASNDFTFVTRWARYIEAGALHFLQSQRGKPWYDPEQAAENRIEYWRGIAICRRDAYVNTTTNQSKSRPPSWV